MGDEQVDPLDWLNKLAEGTGDDADMARAVRPRLVEYYRQLGSAPKELPDRAGPQISHPQLAEELRSKLDPSLHGLVDLSFGQEAQAHNRMRRAEAAPFEAKAQSALKWAPAAQQAADFLKTVTLGYGPSFQVLSGHSKEETDRAYQRGVSQALLQRLQEAHPEMTDEQLKQAYDEQIGGATIGGGVGGFLAEKALPAGIKMTAAMAPFGLLAKGAGLALGGARAVAGASRLAQAAGLGKDAAQLVATVGGAAARGGAAGAAYAGLRAPEMDEAGDLYSRAVRALKEAPVMAAGEALGQLVKAVPFEGGVRRLFGGALSQQATKSLAEFTRDRLALAAQSAGIQAAGDPKMLTEHPGALIADALTTALFPQSIPGLRKAGAWATERAISLGDSAARALAPEGIRDRIPSVRRELEQADIARAAKLREAILNETLDRSREDVIEQLNGMRYLPGWMRGEVLSAHRGQRERAMAEAAAAGEAKAKQASFDAAVDAGHEARAARLPGSRELDVAHKEFESATPPRVQNAILAKQEAMDREADVLRMPSVMAALRSETTVDKVFQLMTDPAIQAAISMPSDVQGVQALRNEAVFAIDRGEAMVKDAKDPALKARFAGETEGLKKALAFLDQHLSNLATNPGMATRDEAMTARADQFRAPGAQDGARAEAREALADNVEAGARAPAPPPQPSVGEPGERWSPPEVSALSDHLRTYFRIADVLDATQGDPDSDRRMKLQSEHDLLRKDIDRALVAKEGRGLDELIASIPADSPAWTQHPALLEISRNLPLVDSQSKTLRRSYAEGKTELPHMDAFAAVAQEKVGDQVRAHADRIISEQRLGAVPDAVDAVHEYAQDALMHASQVYGRLNRDGARDSRWMQGAIDYAIAEARNSTNAYAKRYATYLEVRRQAKARVLSIDEEVGAAKKAIDVADTEKLQPGDPSSPMKTVLALAKQEGGPLSGVDDATAAMVASVYISDLAYSKAPRGQRRNLPGKRPYALAREVYIAEHGEAEWMARTNAERAELARSMERELQPRVAQLHAYLKSLTSIKSMGGEMLPNDPSTKDSTGEDGDSVVHLQSGLWVDPRKAMDFIERSFWNTGKENRHSTTLRDVATARPMSWMRWVLERALGTHESVVGTTNFAKGIELDTRKHKERNRAERRIEKINDEAKAAGLQPEHFLEVGRYLDGYAQENNGVALDPNTARSKFKESVAAFGPRLAELLTRHADAFREEADLVHAAATTENPSIGKVRSYLPHFSTVVGDPGKSIAAHLAERFGDLAEWWTGTQKDYARDVELEQGRERGGKPFSGHTLTRTAHGDFYDLDPYRAFSRYLGPMWDYVGRKRIQNWWNRTAEGDYKPLERVAHGDQLHEVMNQFLGSDTSSDNAVKLGGKYWKLADKAKPGQENFTLHLLGDPSNRMVLRAVVGEDGKIDWRRKLTRKGMLDEHGEGGAYVTEERQVSPQIKQGGFSSIKSADGFVDSRRMDLAEQWVTNMVGRKPMGAAMKSVNTIVRVMNLKQFGLLNHVAAINNTVAGSLVSLAEFGPKYAGLAARRMADPRVRAWAEREGIIRKDVSPLGRLGPGATLPEKVAAGTMTAAEKSSFMMQWTDNQLRLHSFLSGYYRARDAVKSGGVPEDAAAELRRQGVPEASLAEIFARQQGFVAASRTGALMTAANMPGMLNNPVGKLLLQYKRPAILFASTGVKMASRAVRQGEFGPLVRFGALSALVYWIDKAFHSNIGDRLGPRIADLGKDSIGIVTKPLLGVASPADIAPSLDDPEKGGVMNAIGNMRVPLPDPMGEGPALSSMIDFSRAAIAWMKGDDSDLAQQYWEQKSLSDRTVDNWVPGAQRLRDFAAMLNPDLPITRLKPSSDPERPWLMLDEQGRLKYRTDQDELTRRFMLGSIANGRTIESLREFDRLRRIDERQQGERRFARRQWYDLMREAHQTGDPAALAKAHDLAASMKFDRSDYEREQYLREMPPWARFSGKSADQKFEIIRRRVSRMDEFGDSRQQLLDVIHANFKSIEDLSPANQQAFGKMIRGLTGGR